MSSRNYNLRSSPSRRGLTTTTSTSAASTSYSSTTSVSSSGFTGISTDARTLTPAPVQRTLYMEEEDDDDEDEEVVEPLGGRDDDVEEVQVMGRFGRGGRLAADAEEEEGETEDDDDDDDDGDDIGSDRGFRRGQVRSAVAVQREGAFGKIRRRAANSDFVAKLYRYRHVQQATSAARQLWQFVVRNSFMTMNFLWLLVPLGCFLVAILVPHYMTTAIRYVDILTTSSTGFQANLAYEKGMMRSIVQEIVDVKLLTMQDEMTALRNTIVTQEREVDALRLLHESLRHVHDETQKKLSVVDSNSILSIHIEHVVSKHAETLWKRVLEKSVQTDDALRTTVNQQTELLETVAQQQEELRDLRLASAPASAASPSAKAPTISKLKEKEMKEELNKWKVELQDELQSTLEREVIDMEERMHKSLLTEKQILVDSVKTLNTLDAANPALVSMIESAVSLADKKKAGAPDYAALANGALVVRSESDLMGTGSRSPIKDIFESLFGFSSGLSRFTSSSFCPSPALQLTDFLVPHDIPWWLSRHNARPETALSETKEIGSCWGLSGTSGRLTVKFAKRIFADSVTIDHIPESIATDFSTAPQNFRVFGVAVDRSREAAVEFLPFGNFTYARGGTASQTFRVISPLSQRVAIDAATLEITSNHGHPDYTCLYRFQVHGTPAP